MSVIELNNENFQTETASGVYLVDFWAEWCGPCQQMLPVFHEFADNAPAWLKVWKVNVDEAWEIAQSFRIMSIPTIMVFKDGKAVEQKVWVQTKESLAQLVAKHLDSPEVELKMAA